MSQIKSKIRPISVDDLAARDLEFSKGAETSKSISPGQKSMGFDWRVLKGTAILVAGAAALAAGQPLIQGWNAQDAVVPTVAVSQVESATQALMATRAQIQESIKKEVTAEAQALAQMQTARNTMEVSLSGDHAKDSQAFREASYRLDDFIYEQFDAVEAANLKIIQLLKDQRANLERTMAGQSDDAVPAEARLASAMESAKEIRDIDAQLAAREQTRVKLHQQRDDMYVEFAVLSGASEFLEAVGNYESGNQPELNHYSKISASLMQGHEKRIERLDNSEFGPVAISRATFDKLDVMGKSAMRKLENDPTQSDNMSIQTDHIQQAQHSATARHKA